METILIIAITALATVGVVATGKILYDRLVIIIDQIKIKRKRIARIDFLWDSVCHMDSRLEKVEKTLLKVDKWAKNFDRVMDTHHKNINKNIDEIMKSIATRFTKLESAKKG